MNPEQINEIEKLVDEVSHSYIKADAVDSLNQLQAIYSHNESSLDPYARDKFSELIIYANTASGRVKEKGHWINVTNAAFGKFRSAIR